jgi:hypothetical protein
VTRLSTGAFAVLVAATIGAFFVTQHLQVTTPLIQGYPSFAPAVIDPLHPVRCGKYKTGSATISFYLQHRSDDVDAYVIDESGGAIVATLAIGRHMRKDVRHPDGVFHWNGRESNGQLAPDGTYYLRVILLHQGRRIDLNQPQQVVRIKTVPPHPVITSVTPTQIPTSSGSTRVEIHYAGNENRGGTILLYRLDVRGAPELIKSFPTPWKGQTAVWDGTVRQHRQAPAGTYLLAFQVTDAACNTGRYPTRIPPPAGTSNSTIVVQ